MDSNSALLVTTLLLVFASAIAGGIVARKLRQPMLAGYIVAGILFGNLFPRLARLDLLRLIADSGVTLLLFTLGLEFSFHRLRRILGIVAWSAVAQIVLFVIGFFVFSMLFGFSLVPALFLATAASLSSTAVVIKVLSERGELDTVPGEAATGWLVVQDLAVVPIMLLLSAVASIGYTQEASIVTVASLILVSLVKAAGAIAVILLLGRGVMTKALAKIAGLGSREIYVLFTVGIVLLSSVLTYTLGLSAAIGAFIAGLLIAETTQNHAMFAEIRPLRDLFVVVFFVSLGMVLPAAFFMQTWMKLLLFAIVVMVVKFGLVYVLLRFLRFHRKTAFLVGVGLTQMSEFGFIIAREGLSKGALSSDEYTFLVALTFVTIVASAPLLTAGHGLYYWLLRALGKRWPILFHAKEELADMKEGIDMSDHVVLCGYGRVGKYIGRALEMAGVPYVVVEYNHTVVSDLKSKGVRVVYGDPADKDVLDWAQVDLARAVIIAIPDRHTQELVVGHAQSLNRRIKIICRTHHEEDQKRLKALGVATVVQPEFEAAISIVERLLTDFGVLPEEISGKISRLKIEHGLG